MGIRDEIFTLGTLLYVDSLHVGLRSLETQEREEKNLVGGVIGDMWG